MKSINKPLVIGGSHHNTYGLVRCFGEAGTNVDLILYDCKNSFIEKSKYVEDVWYCDTENDVLNRLVELVNNPLVHYVVFTAPDQIASLLDIHFDEFNGKCDFFNCGKAGLLTRYMEKDVQTELANKVGFAVPQSKSFAKGQELVFDTFPCIIKPLASIDGGKRIVICNGPEELAMNAKVFADVEKVLIQQYLSIDEEIVLLGFSSKGKIWIPGYIAKIREVRGGTTYSTTAPVDKLDSVLVDNAQKLVESIGYEGLFGIECIKSRGQYYFIEINLRNDATSYSLAVAGCNLPFYYFEDRIKNQTFEHNPVIQTITSIVEVADFNNVLHRKVGLLKWLKQRKNAKCKYYYSKDDKQPGRKALNQYIRHLAGRFFPFK